jgi:EAL domain-containing protein (putative c-di-GMP-specific phosphodiesterase class I)
MITGSFSRIGASLGISKHHRQTDRLQERVKSIAGAAQPVSNELAAAIANDQLFLEYQPKLDWRLGRITGAEALVRWNHPTHGIIPPRRFIPPATDSDLVRDLTDWVISQAAAQAASWHAEGIEIDIAVNISAGDLDDSDFPDRMQQHCRTASINPSYLTLELSEVGVMREAQEVSDILTRLRLKGFNLSVDDFGTGSSSHTQLQKFSEAKIDLSFVTQMMNDPGSGRVVELLIDTAQKLGLRSVAEGVENDEVLNCLLDLGCDKIQGFYISRPIAADLMSAFVHEFASEIEPPEPEVEQVTLDYLNFAARSEATALCLQAAE